MGGESNEKGEERDFNVFVGAETGILKGISINPKVNLAKNFHNLKALSKDQEITCMNWGMDESEILLGLRNQTVKIYDPLSKSFSLSFNAKTDDENPLRGVARFCGDGALLTASGSGILKLWRFKEEERFSVNTIETGIVENAKSGRRKKTNKIGRKLEEEDEESAVKEIQKLSSGRNLQVMRCKNHLAATGGKENDLQVWDLHESTLIFRAKNVKPDFLQLRVPIWISDLTFLDDNAVSTVSRHGHIRLYDLRGSQRRPVMDLEYPDAEPLTAVASTVNCRQILVGSARGAMALFDFRQETKGMVRKYKGSVGSIRSIDSCGGTSQYFASVGLDRFLRVYNVNSKKIVSKLYLKSRLNCVLLKKGFDPLATETERGQTKDSSAMDLDNHDSDIEIIEDEETLWDQMEVVGKRKAESEQKVKKLKT